MLYKCKQQQQYFFMHSFVLCQLKQSDKQKTNKQQYSLYARHGVIWNINSDIFMHAFVL